MQTRSWFAHKTSDDAGKGTRGDAIRANDPSASTSRFAVAIPERMMSMKAIA
jgi:hypothetical protein